MSKNAENSLATYAERIEPQNKLVKVRHVQDTIRHIEKSQAALLDLGRNGVTCVEEMRLAGVSWLAASDKNQYDLYFYDYAETLMKPEQRKLLTREIVKTAIHFANVIPETIKDFQMALPFIVKAGHAFDALRKNRRGIEQSHIPPSLFAEFTSVGKTACATLRKLEAQCPLDAMDETELDVLIKEFLPVYECVDKAIKLRKHKLIET